MPDEKWPLRLARWLTRAAVAIGAIIGAYKHSEQLSEFASSDVPQYVRKLVGTSVAQPSDIASGSISLPKDIADRDKCLQDRHVETLESNARIVQLRADAEACFRQYNQRQCVAFQDRYTLYLELRKRIAEKCKN